ncbi:hypothetical protein MKX03_021784 [Papaver bracteatum]|nr:hypothetical protein MKX03_021784 [Papaver bracteatum]
MKDESEGGTTYEVLENIWIGGFCKQLNFVVKFHKTETYEDEVEDRAHVEETNDKSEDVDSESESERESESYESEGDTCEEGTEKRIKKVEFDINCSCQKFEFEGILCRHAINILIRNNILLISDKYILRRWRKDIVRSHTKVKVSYSCWENNESSVRFNQLSVKFSEAADLACVSKEQHTVVNEWLDEIIKKLSAMKIEVENVKQAEIQGVSLPSIKDPKNVKSKGRPRATFYKPRRSKKRAKKKVSTENGKDHIQTEMPDSLYDGVVVPQEHFTTAQMTQEQVYTSTARTGRDTHHIAPRGKQVRGGRGTRG